MPRKVKGVHTSPEKAGIKNMPENYPDTHKDPDNTMAKLLPLYKIGMSNYFEYKGNWTDEQLAEEVSKFFAYCSDNEIKPAKAGLELWLGVSRSQYYDWSAKVEKYGAKSDIISHANRLMELSYIGRAEKYPTANIFLLKSSHGHIETSKVDVTTNGSSAQTTDEIEDTISKLGLDK